MTHELDTAAALSAGGWLKRAHAAPPEGDCANCGAALQGPWCHACGQSAEDFHRSIWKLCGEVVEGVLHMDGRLWRTLPDLILHPSRLTRAYLEGHRAPQIPPLRLFLVVLLGVFVVGELTHVKSGGGKGSTQFLGGAAAVSVHKDPVAGQKPQSMGLSDLTPEERVKLKDQLKDMHVELGGQKASADSKAWLQDRLGRAIMEPERFMLIIQQWSERFAFLMMPVATLLLSLLFVFQRRFFIFDHAIFALHSLSAMGLGIILALILNRLPLSLGGLLMLPAPVHLFAHMRGVYRTSVIGTLIRMALLFMGSVMFATLLVIGLVAVGLNGLAEG